jgi:hypothetical protein
MPTSVATLGDMIAYDHWLSVHCDRQTPPCRHSHVVWLANKVGRNYPCDARSLTGIGWSCTKCGSRRVTFRSASRSNYALDPDPDEPF